MNNAKAVMAISNITAAATITNPTFPAEAARLISGIPLIEAIPSANNQTRTNQRFYIHSTQKAAVFLKVRFSVFQIESLSAWGGKKLSEIECAKVALW